jgi:hypothetical protein
MLLCGVIAENRSPEVLLETEYPALTAVAGMLVTTERSCDRRSTVEINSSGSQACRNGTDAVDVATLYVTCEAVGGVIGDLHTASSSVSQIIIESTGPNISCRAIAISGAPSAKTAGRNRSVEIGRQHRRRHLGNIRG